MNIGVFDSGLGGLTILKSLLKELPEYNYIYLGDNAHLPYGGRSPATLYQFTRDAVKFLFEKNCELIVLACNTATANALRRIQQEYLPENYPQRRVLGVIKPTVEEAGKKQYKKIGVIATKATVKSEAFIHEIKKINPAAIVIQASGPLLVPFIEEGETDTPSFDLILKKYLEIFQKEKVDSLILACTHYGIVKDKIENILGKDVYVVEEGAIVAKKLRQYLQRHPEIDIRMEKMRKREFFVTDLTPGYEKMMAIFLGSHWQDNKIQLTSLSI